MSRIRGNDGYVVTNGRDSADGWNLDIGARVIAGNKVRFRVWAPYARTVGVKLVRPGGDTTVPLSPADRGYHEGIVDGIRDGQRYFYVLDGDGTCPDPASRSQPGGVHAGSEVVDPARFPWGDRSWSGLALDDMIIYEIHVGTFSAEGTFGAVVPRIGYLKELGVTAIELMPVAQFPGLKNWGYDGTYLFAPQNSYGGPDGLKALIDQCHRDGMAVILDVVYNHLGPEGNYLGRFGPYFTDRYKTPWGEAVNYDGEWSDEVRHFFISNALYWIAEYHLDGLRIDAIHGIFDCSALHVLAELGSAVHGLAKELGRRVQVIVESDLNDVRVVRRVEEGGLGLDAQWNDDFHHALHALLTGEDGGYYQDFGRLAHLAKAMREGFVYSGEYSRFRKRKHGNSSRSCDPERFVVFSQNHDQVGNRRSGDRPGTALSLEELKLAASVVILSPYVPLLFMGEEYGETSPFHYFVDHSDPALIEAVRRGRREEFHAFARKEEVPDPQAEEVFLGSKLAFELSLREGHRELLAFYKELLRIRKNLAALRHPGRESMDTIEFPDQRLLAVVRWSGAEKAACLYNFGRESVSARLPGEASWRRILDSSSEAWGGRMPPGPREACRALPVSPMSCAVWICSDKGGSR